MFLKGETVNLLQADVTGVSYVVMGNNNCTSLLSKIETLNGVSRVWI